MIKKFNEFINEDFTDLYKRWKNKEVRKEDKLNKDTVLEFAKKYKISENNIIFHDDKADFKCDLYINDIEDINFKIGEVFGNFDISSLKITQITNLCPQKVHGFYTVSNNPLIDFTNSPEEVDGSFIAVECDRLQSLKGLPKNIGGTLTITTGDDRFSESDIPQGTVVEGQIRFTIRRRRKQ